MLCLFYVAAFKLIDCISLLAALVLVVAIRAHCWVSLFIGFGLLIAFSCLELCCGICLFDTTNLV